MDRLPDELVIQILQVRADPTTLAHVCLVSRRYHRLAVPFLYRTIRLEKFALNRGKNRKPSRPFSRPDSEFSGVEMLCRWPHIGKHIHQISDTVLNRNFHNSPVVVPSYSEQVRSVVEKAHGVHASAFVESLFRKKQVKNLSRWQKFLYYRELSLVLVLILATNLKTASFNTGRLPACCSPVTRFFTFFTQGVSGRQAHGIGTLDSSFADEAQVLPLGRLRSVTLFIEGTKQDEAQSILSRADIVPVMYHPKLETFRILQPGERTPPLPLGGLMGGRTTDGESDELSTDGSDLNTMADSEEVSTNSMPDTDRPADLELMPAPESRPDMCTLAITGSWAGPSLPHCGGLGDMLSRFHCLRNLELQLSSFEQSGLDLGDALRRHGTHLQRLELKRGSRKTPTNLQPPIGSLRNHLTELVQLEAPLEAILGGAGHDVMDLGDVLPPSTRWLRTVLGVERTVTVRQREHAVEAMFSSAASKLPSLEWVAIDIGNTRSTWRPEPVGWHVTHAGSGRFDAFILFRKEGSESMIPGRDPPNWSLGFYRRLGCGW